ncbi:MAG: asparaginase [Clostridia bacterium]|nr:asparaginase [Clostridia bacterium]
MKKISVIFTGGTIGSLKRGNSIQPDGGAAFILLEKYKSRSGRDCNFDISQPLSVLSENMTDGYMALICRCIREKLDGGADGVIVTHGTDTLQYTACAASYVLGADCAPVVFVSSNYPLTDARANGVDNFIAAVDFIERKGGRGVFISYLNRGEQATNIHRATRVLPYMPYDDRLYSLNGVYGDIYWGQFNKNSDYTECADGQKTADIKELAEGGKVLMLNCAPGLYYPDTIPDGVRAVILDAYHSGTADTVSENIRRFAQTAKERGIPFYISCSWDGVEYQSVSAFGSLGFKVMPMASPIAMYMKIKMGLDPYIPLGGDIK